MGARFHITLYAPSEAQAESAARAAFERIARLEDVLSDYMADSELMRLTAAPVGTPVSISPDLFTVLERGMQFSAATAGAFDLTAGPLTRLWRFSRKRGVLPTPQELVAARAAVDWRSVGLDETAQTATLTRSGTRLDAGGIAKGYAADEALKVLNACGIPRALVAASGDVRAGEPPPGKPGWVVTIASPAPETAPPTLLLRNAAVSTSGDTEQFVEIEGVRYSHILNPLTGLGLTNRIQATVIAPDATTSDALATACCVLGPERAIRLVESIPRASVIVVTQEGPRSRIWRSQRAP
jgi:thiamine biosynthesis lipoprotein